MFFPLKIFLIVIFFSSVSINGLKWRRTSNDSWTELKSFAFEGNKKELPPPFYGELYPINYGISGDQSITSCISTSPTLNVKKKLKLLILLIIVND